MGAYDEDSQTIGLAQFSGGVIVFTESHWSTDTPLRITLAEERPIVDNRAYDHMAVAAFDCPSGELRIFSPKKIGGGERKCHLPPGKYGLLACGNGFGRATEYGDNGSDRYELWLWPTEQLPARHSLKRGLPDA